MAAEAEEETTEKAEEAEIAPPVLDQELCAALEEQATAGRKGGRSKSSYPMAPTMDYSDSHSVEASIARHKLRLKRAAAAIASPPMTSPTHEVQYDRRSPVKRSKIATTPPPPDLVP